MSFPRWFKSMGSSSFSSSASSSSVKFPAASKTLRNSFSYQKDLDDEADESSEFEELSDLSPTNSSISELCSYRNEDEYCGREGRISTAKADVMAKWRFLTKEERIAKDDGNGKTKSSPPSSVKSNLISSSSGELTFLLQEEYKKIARLEPEKPRDWQTRDYELKALKQKEGIEAPEELEVLWIDGSFTQEDENKENKNVNATTKKSSTLTSSPSLCRTTPFPLILPSSSSVCNSLDSSSSSSSSFSSSHHLCKFSQFIQQPKETKMKRSYFSSNLYPSVFPSCSSTINSSYASAFIISYPNSSADSSDASSIIGPSETARRQVSSGSSTNRSLQNVAAAAAAASYSNSSTSTVRPFSSPVSFFGSKGRQRRFSFRSDSSNNKSNSCHRSKLLTKNSSGGFSMSSKTTADSSSKMRSNDSIKYNNKSSRSSLFSQWFFSLKSSSKRITKLSSSFEKTSSFFSTASSSPSAFLDCSASSSSSFLSPFPSTSSIHPSISITPRLSFRCLQSFSSLKYKMSNHSSTLCVCRQNEGGEESSCGFPVVCRSYLYQSWWMRGMINAADRLSSRLKVHQQLKANCMAEVFLCVWLQKEVSKEAENLFMNAKTREEFEALPKDNQLDEDFGLITLGLEYDDITAYYYFRLRSALRGLKIRKFLLTPFCHPEHWFLAFDASRIEDHKEF